MVEEVEELAPKTKPDLFGQLKLPLERDISLPGSKTPQHIASEISLLPGGRWSKGCWIESLASRILRPVEHKRHSGHYVRARIQIDAVRKDKSANYVHRRSRPRENEAIHRPAAQRGAGKRGRFWRGQTVGHASRECMADVKVRVATVYIRICDRAWRVDVVCKCIGRCIINRVGPCIRCQSLQSSRQTPLELELQGLVVRCR